jgi:hypothetical protein
MVIDYSITIGNLVEIASIIGGGLMVVITLRGDVANMKAEVGGASVVPAYILKQNIIARTPR